MFILHEEQLACFSERKWKKVYFTDGEFNGSSDLEKAYVVGIPFVAGQDSTKLSCPVPSPPSLHTILANIESGLKYCK